MADKYSRTDFARTLKERTSLQGLKFKNLLDKHPKIIAREIKLNREAIGER